MPMYASQMSSGATQNQGSGRMALARQGRSVRQGPVNYSGRGSAYGNGGQAVNTGPAPRPTSPQVQPRQMNQTGDMPFNRAPAAVAYRPPSPPPAGGKQWGPPGGPQGPMRAAGPGMAINPAISGQVTRPGQPPAQAGFPSNGMMAPNNGMMQQGTAQLSAMGQPSVLQGGGQGGYDVLGGAAPMGAMPEGEGGHYNPAGLSPGEVANNLAQGYRNITDPTFWDNARQNNPGGPAGGSGGGMDPTQQGFFDNIATTMFNTATGNVTDKAGNMLSNMSGRMTREDMANIDKYFGESTGAYRDIMDMARGIGDTTEYEDAVRQNMMDTVNQEKQAQLRSLNAQAGRGGAMSSGAQTGIYGNAQQALQQGERGLAQDVFGRKLAGAQTGMQGLGMGASSLEDLLGEGFTGNKELLALLLTGGRTGMDVMGQLGDVLGGKWLGA